MPGGPWWAIKSENMLTINDNAIETIFYDEEKQKRFAPTVYMAFGRLYRLLHEKYDSE